MPGECASRLMFFTGTTWIVTCLIMRGAANTTSPAHSFSPPSNPLNNAFNNLTWKHCTSCEVKSKVILTNFGNQTNGNLNFYFQNYPCKLHCLEIHPLPSELLIVDDFQQHKACELRIPRKQTYWTQIWRLLHLCSKLLCEIQAYLCTAGGGTCFKMISENMIARLSH